MVLFGDPYDEVNGLLLEKLVSSELEGSLEEVSSGGGPESGEESASTLGLDDLAETTDHTLVVCDGVKLDVGLDAVDIVSGCLPKINVRSRWALLLLRRTSWPHRFWHQILGSGGGTYTSTGVRAPWVTEQQTAPARANLE